MNVVNLAPGPSAERLASEKPNVYIVEPDEAAIRALEAAFNFHDNPSPYVDYRGVALPPGAKEVFEEPPEMDPRQARLHEETARMQEWQLGHVGVGLEVSEAIVLVELPEAA